MRKMKGLKQEVKADHRKYFKPSLDLFSARPEYDYPSFTSWTGFSLTSVAALFMVFYMVLTLMDFITEAPELVNQGSIQLPREAGVITFPIPEKICLSIDYYGGSGERRQVNATNNDPYFRFEFNYVTFKKQEKTSSEPLPVVDRCNDAGCMQCVDTDGTLNYKLQGQFLSDVYQYVEVALARCRDPQCASEVEIDKAINDWVRVVFLTSQETFDANKFHHRLPRERRGVFPGEDKQSRSYLLPGQTVKHDWLMLGRQIQHEKRIIGSPPYPESVTEILSFDRLDNTYAPYDEWEGRMTEFFVQLDDKVSQEETAYWMPSILDLFGLWGALFAFLSDMSFGLLGRWLNRRWSRRSFDRQAEKYAVVKNASAGMIRPGKDDNSFSVVPDLRLFDAAHFDRHGRLDVSVLEFKYPSSVYGELRAFAVEQHRRKYEAARKVARWWRMSESSRILTNGKRSRVRCSAEDSYAFGKESAKDS